MDAHTACNYKKNFGGNRGNLLLPARWWGPRFCSHRRGFPIDITSRRGFPVLIAVGFLLTSPAAFRGHWHAGCFNERRDRRVEGLHHFGACRKGSLWALTLSEHQASETTHA